MGQSIELIRRPKEEEPTFLAATHALLRRRVPFVVTLASPFVFSLSN